MIGVVYGGRILRCHDFEVYMCWDCMASGYHEYCIGIDNSKALSKVKMFTIYTKCLIHNLFPISSQLSVCGISYPKCLICRSASLGITKKLQAVVAGRSHGATV